MIFIQSDLCDGCGLCKSACPFGAIESLESEMSITAGCRGCNLCIKACPQNAIKKDEAHKISVNKSDYSGILVYVEHVEGRIASVTYELIGKARELAAAVGQEVRCLFIGADIANKADGLLKYGVSKVFVYQHSELKYYRADTYANVFEDCVRRCRPSAVLVGATSVGRSLAPRVATRCATGLTADCTGLFMRPNTDLVQVRPAFGGNIMAQIVTTSNRPQFATVRARVMDTPLRVEPCGVVELVPVSDNLIHSKILLANVRKKELKKGIEHADTLIVAGKAIKKTRDMDMLQELAMLLNGRVAATRPLVESGIADYSMQIGLSGRAVRPRLIITCGVSGAVQFVAGMKASEYIFAINKNPDAPIMKIANYAVVGDLFEIVPELIRRIKEERSHAF